MDSFQKQIQLELLKQQRMLDQQQQILSASPEGILLPRQRKHGCSYYHQRKIREGRNWKNIQSNITDDHEMQQMLLDKRVAEKMMRTLQNNIPLLQQMQNHYQTVDFRDLTKELAQGYDRLLKEKELRELTLWQNAPYKKCPYYPEYLTHRTAFGEYTRSKSEVIIANALYSFGIPNHYEEELAFPNYGQRSFYPDFTIRLPHHRYLYWEHWGLLSRERYRRENIEKLAVYQENGLIIGKNLIITQDDAHGNCQSQIVYDIIERFILPHFEGIVLPGRLQ